MRNVVLIAAVTLLGGCAATPGGPDVLRQRIAAAAEPLLTLDPNADWTANYNALVELAPESVVYLADHPRMRRRAAPDDLRVMLHVSLLHLLANPSTKPPLTVNAFETVFDVVHFEPKVRGRRLGEVHMPLPVPPLLWHALYPAAFDQRLAAMIDLEADRRALRAWFELHRGHPSMLATRLRLRPRVERLWQVLTRRRADRWSYSLGPSIQRIAQRTPGPPLLTERTYDYNLVRAACIQLGSSADEAIQRGLIELVAHDSAVTAHNARFALRFSPDARIRAVLHKQPARR